MATEYSDIEKDSINRTLNKLGVEPEAQQTTLPLQARQDLQDLITSRAQESYPAILFFPSLSATDTETDLTDNVHHCDLLYQLYIKENHLFRNRVYRSSILDMYSALNEAKTFIDEDDSISLPNRKQTAKTQVVMGVEDFFRTNTANMSTEDHRVREVYERYLRYSMFGARRLLVLKSAMHPTHYEDTWSMEFSALLIKTAKIIRVTAP